MSGTFSVEPLKPDLQVLVVLSNSAVLHPGGIPRAHRTVALEPRSLKLSLGWLRGCSLPRMVVLFHLNVILHNC